MKVKQLYHGWLIELIPEPAGYSFRCWFPGKKTALCDRQTYSTRAQALRVAKVRADLEAAYLALIRFLHEIYQKSHLTSDEHLALATSVLEFVIVLSKKSQRPPT
ncbi:hypothetical protein H6F96_21610 [Microcoleus sp. FACHB-53]|nr:hypothetical protein [Microcoleus sp. FACHB-53]